MILSQRLALLRRRRGYPTVVLFDDECLLCSRSVQWLLRHDKLKTMRFASLRSTAAKEIIRHLDDGENADTVLVVDGGRVYSLSRAVVQIFWRLGAGWRIVGMLLYLVPACVRNTCYRMIARHRYGWFGRSDSCILPPDEERWRFL